ncbi:unnamed protein product [Dibothriocephalus latus]|uniref:Signal recognition particle SRP72 subunit RNA-binding domain-containing protein n=1 Tax=Dibothriocephalus latus TaxID=60516 RepID=A0A3P7LW28_DIBLA|nr:unnamed protein product [Dibothriocephalus latus]
MLALLIQAYSKFDHAKAEAASRDLEFKEKLSEKEVDSLENSFLLGVKSVKKAGRAAAAAATGGTPKTVVTATKETPVQKTPGSGSKKLQQQKKKRKVRLPKNFDPNIPPDPERWLPRRERTGYRGKRRDKRVTSIELFLRLRMAAKIQRLIASIGRPHQETYSSGWTFQLVTGY